MRFRICLQLQSKRFRPVLLANYLSSENGKNSGVPKMILFGGLIFVQSGSRDVCGSSKFLRCRLILERAKHSQSVPFAPVTRATHEGRPVWFCKAFQKINETNFFLTTIYRFDTIIARLLLLTLCYYVIRLPAVVCTPYEIRNRALADVAQSRR